MEDTKPTVVIVLRQDGKEDTYKIEPNATCPHFSVNDLGILFIITNFSNKSPIAIYAATSWYRVYEK